MRFRIFKRLLVMSACFVVLLAVPAQAQEFKYTVELDRLVGHQDGELIISNNSVEYRRSKKEESRSWSYGDIRLFEILSPTKVRIWTYKDRKLVFREDESLTFKIIEGQIDSTLSDFLRERIKRPFVTSILEQEDAVVAQIPVKHSHRLGGCEGVLRVYSDKLIYESKTGHDSRSWRWTDVRSVGHHDSYRFDVETFEPQTGASSRSFNFVLKEQMDDRTYDMIWSRVYRPTPLLRVSESGMTK